MIVRGKSQLVILLTLYVGVLCFSQLGVCAQEKPRVDLFGDPLPSGAIARLGTVRLRHHDEIVSLAVSSDGRIAASAGGSFLYETNQRVRVWDLDSGREIKSLPIPMGLACNVVFSPNGQYLACLVLVNDVGGDEDRVYVWDTTSWKLLHLFRDPSEHPGAVRKYGLAFSPDSRILASTGQNRRLRLRDSALGKEIVNVAGGATAIEFSADGKLMACAGDEIKIRDARSGAVIHSFRGPKGVFVYSLAFSPDAKHLLTGADFGPVGWWDVASGRSVREFRGGLVGASPDGTFAAIRVDKEVQIWNVARGEEVRRFPRQERFSGYSRDCYWTGALSQDGLRLVTTDWSTIRVIDTRTGADRHKQDGHSAPAVLALFTKDGSQVVSAGDASIRFWDVKTAQTVAELKDSAARVYGASPSLDRMRVATISLDRFIRVWDVNKKSLLATTDRIPILPRLVALAPDGDVVAASGYFLSAKGQSSAITLFDAADGKKRADIKPAVQANAISFFPHGKTIAELGSDFIFYDIRTGQKTPEIPAPRNDWDAGLAISPDGNILAATSGELEQGKALYTVYLLDLPTQVTIGKLRGPQSIIRSIAFSSDHKLLAAGEADGMILVWEFPTRKLLGKFSGHRGRVLSLGFSPDGAKLASSGSDTSVLVWDLSSLPKPAPSENMPLKTAQLEALWKKLVSADAEEPYEAITRLVARPSESLPFLKDHIAKLAADPQQVKKDLHTFELRIRRSVQVFEYVGSLDAKETLQTLARLELTAASAETVARAVQRLSRKPTSLR